MVLMLCIGSLTPFWLQKVCMSICVIKVHDLGWNSLPWGMLCSPSSCFQLQGVACCKGGRVKQVWDNEHGDKTVINFTQTRAGSQRSEYRCETLLSVFLNDLGKQSFVSRKHGMSAFACRLSRHVTGHLLMDMERPVFYFLLTESIRLVHCSK